MPAPPVIEDMSSALPRSRPNAAGSLPAGAWPSPKHLARAIRWGWCALFAGMLTLCVLQFSYLHGRLIEAPAYDDIGYFNDGAQRLQTFYDRGVPGLVNGYRAHPPHSPFESAMAVAAFAIFGIHAWAPYVFNFLLAFGCFLAIDFLLRGVYLWQKLLCFIFLATIPIVGMAVHEFRPDFAVALFTAVGAFILMSGPFILGPPRRQIAAGVWFGIAMMTKPPEFPQTLALAGAAIVLATLIDLLTLRRRLRFGTIAKAWTAVLVPFILIPLPHYIYDRRNIFTYIWYVFFGPFKEGFKTRIPLSQHLLYYLNGVGGQAMLGHHAWLLLCLLGVCAAALMLVGRRRDRITVPAMLLFLVAAWIIPTVDPVKTEFFGLGFQVILVFTAIYLLGRLLVAERVRADHLRLLGTAALLVFLVLGIWEFQWPTRHGNRYAGWEQQRRDIAQGVFDTIIAHSRFEGSQVAPLPDPRVPEDDKVYATVPTVVFCGIGDVNPPLIQFMAIQHQVKLNCLFNSETNNPADIIRDFAKADFIFCAQSGTRLIADFVPSASIQDTLLAAVRARPDWEQVGKWTFMLSNGRSLFLFMRREFRGFQPIKNLGKIEGPRPEYANRLVRWGYGPASHLTIMAPCDGIYNFSWLARSDFQSEVITVKVDGREIAREPVIASGKQFSETRIPLDLKAGSHDLELDYTYSHTEAAAARAVLFERLVVARQVGGP